MATSAKVDPSPARRAETLTNALQLIHNDVGFIPLHQQTLAWAMSDHIDADVRADNQIPLPVDPPWCASDLRGRRGPVRQIAAQVGMGPPVQA